MAIFRGRVRYLVVLWLGSISWPAAAQTGGPGFEIAVHARTTRATARAEQAAWLSVTLPLDALARPSAQRVAALADTAPAPATAQASAAPVASVAPAFSFAQLRSLADFSRRATAVALGAAGVGAERRRLDAMSTRARVSAALPELRLRVQRNTDQALRWAPTSDDPYRVTQADGAGTTLEASATFRLDRLLFAREELSVERHRQQAGVEHLKLERQVQDALLALFRARELGCSESADDEARVQQLIALVERITQLDVLTAGWFSEQAPSFSRAVWGFPEAILGLCSAPAPPSEAAPTKPVASLENSG